MRSKSRFGMCVTKQQVLPRVVCLWRVSSSRSCCDKFYTRGIFDQNELEICSFSPKLRALSLSIL